MPTPVDPLGNLACTNEPLTHFVPNELGEPTEQDVAEIGRLLAMTKSKANAAFLATLLPDPPDKMLAPADVSEIRLLIAKSDRPMNKIHLASMLSELPAASPEDLVRNLSSQRRPSQRRTMRLALAGCARAWPRCAPLADGIGACAARPLIG